MTRTLRRRGRGRRLLALVGLGVAVSTLTACGLDSDPLAGASGPSTGSTATVVVGSAPSTQGQVLGELYAQAIRAEGGAATTRGVASREASLTALRDGSVSLLPELTGDLLLSLDPAATATTEAEITSALPAAVGPDLAVLEPSRARDQAVYVVTRQTSQAKGLRSLDGLKKISATSVLGGPAELRDRAYGLPGLDSIYGARFRQFAPYASPAALVRDLNANKIQVAGLSSTQAAIPDNGYVTLDDPQSMILPQNVVPLARADVAADATVVAAVNGVQRTLTTADLATLIKAVDTGGSAPDQAAGRWLQAKGLA